MSVVKKICKNCVLFTGSKCRLQIDGKLNVISKNDSCPDWMQKYNVKKGKKGRKR